MSKTAKYVAFGIVMLSMLILWHFGIFPLVIFGLVYILTFFADIEKFRKGQLALKQILVLSFWNLGVTLFLILLTFHFYYHRDSLFSGDDISLFYLVGLVAFILIGKWLRVGYGLEKWQEGNQWKKEVK